MIKETYYELTLFVIGALILLYLQHFIVLGLILMITALVAVIFLKHTVLRNDKTATTEKYYFKIIGLSSITNLVILIGAFFYSFIGIYTDSGYGDPSLTLWNLKDYYGEYSVIDESILFVIIVLITISLNLIFNYFIVFRKLNFSKAKRFLSALTVSVLTAPYLFFVDFGGLLEKLING